LENQVLIFFAVIKGLLDDIPADKINNFETGLNEYAVNNGEEILKEISEKKTLNDELHNYVIPLLQEV